MKTTDNVSPELRKIEKEIDDYYKSNPLLKLPFATAAWSLLAYAEEYMLNQQFCGISGTQDIHSLGSDFITEIEHSVFWIHNNCEYGGNFAPVFDEYLYKVSKELFELGQKYDWFVFAYTCASEGILELQLQGSTIQPTGDFFANIEYEAYNILIDPYEPEEARSSMNDNDFPIDAIQYSVKIEGNRFHYELNKKIITDVKTFLKPLFDRMFLLPSEWQFSCYTLGDFRKVFETICAIAHIHRAARVKAAFLGCQNMGYLNSIYVLTYGKLIRCVAKYSDMSPVQVKSILDDLIYGGSDIKRPVPALQPLIKLNSKHYAIVPHIWICSSAERNFTALLNRMRNQNQKIYEKFTNEKEDLMKERFTTGSCNKDFKFISGNITNLTDVDLAIVNHSEKACLLLELKWFIAPTTAHERINKSKEIKTGISQVLKLKQAFAESHKPLLEKLNIDSSYNFEGAVVSENWIGYGNAQSLEVPVIRANHLITKLNATNSLQSTIEWLKYRKYLPKKGEHFIICRPMIRIGNWDLKWYGIRPLIKDAFFPL